METPETQKEMLLIRGAIVKISGCLVSSHAAMIANERAFQTTFNDEGVDRNIILNDMIAARNEMYERMTEVFTAIEAMLHE